MLANQTTIASCATRNAAAPCRPFGLSRPRRAVVVRAANEADQQASSSNVCKTCGVDLGKAPGGCDGEGRIVGGLGALPGFGWWPIKAYRPCPGLSSAGMDYVRKGQATNEMLFGGVSLSERQQESLEVMKDTADKGIKIDV
eukprot:GHUV01002085.1.p1 GENE.GHUV01002085.1~~GHUV01002085.1.p1  ORF type:complete len:142 (+),score=26.23 GHUV01002085.1:161-586(+)